MPTNQYIIQRKVEEANSLKRYLQGSSSGISTLLGSSKLYHMIQDKCTEADSFRNLVADDSSAGTGFEALLCSAMKSLHMQIEVMVNAYHQRRLNMDKLAGNTFTG